MLFNEDFLNRINDEPIHCVVEITTTCIENVIKRNISNRHQYSKTDYDKLSECYALLIVILDKFKDLSSKCKPTMLEGKIDVDSYRIYEFIDCVNKEFESKSQIIKLEKMKNNFKKQISNSFTYKFSQGDLDRIQILINELREEIKSSDLFEEKHKDRLLRRLEKLQSEMHKKMSDIDRFWGLVGDAGVALGKFGKNAKPFVDRIKEITEIVWRTQSRAEELPSDTPPPFIKNED